MTHQILVVCDHDRLGQIIEMNLRPTHWQVARFTTVPTAQPVNYQPDLSTVDLIILGLSISTTEPLVLLWRTGLIRYVGQVPLLIISDRPFTPDNEMRVYHLEFPFAVAGLHLTVQQLVEAAPAQSRSLLFATH